MCTLFEGIRRATVLHCSKSLAAFKQKRFPAFWHAGQTKLSTGGAIAHPQTGKCALMAAKVASFFSRL
jgi:hypothetical protein